jgi:hypothetical protein
MTDETPVPRTKFDWAIYADATFAGLSVLIPIPLLDLAFEWWFRQRMPRAIARRRNCALKPEVIRVVNQGREGCRQSCLAWPVVLLWQFLKRLSRKILYFLTVKEATDQLSHYWHRAFLLDYMLAMECLNDERSAHIAALALDQVLATATISPLHQLAQQITQVPGHILRTLRRARRGQEDETVVATKSLMARAWENFDDYLAELAGRYHEVYRNLWESSSSPE